MMASQPPKAAMVPKRQKKRVTFVLPKEVRDEIKKLPRKLLERHIDRRLGGLPHPVSAAARESLISHILSKANEEFLWTVDDSFPPDLEIDLRLTPEEEAEIFRGTKVFSDDVVATLNRVVELESRKLLRELKNKWPEERILQDALNAGFNDRLYDRWGPAFEALRMLIVSCLDIGAERSKKIKRLRSRRPVHYVLIRLHARMCQIAEEVVTLLENGLADGAMGRWRTMLELTVVGTLIESGDNTLAERYVAHSIVEEWNQTNEFMAVQVPLGAKPMRSTDLKELKTIYDALISQYGRSFGTLYGWAAEIAGNPKPTFKNLMTLAGKTGMSYHYKIANHDVHAGSRRLNERISDPFNSWVILAGKSNAGMATPGINTAFSLVQMTSLLLGAPRTTQQMLTQKILLRMRENVDREFQRADKQLRREELSLVGMAKSKRIGV